MHSWFNDVHGLSDLIAFIETYTATYSVEEKIAIGFSMGATGAFVLDAVLRFDRVIALVPQALIGSTACPWDRRFFDAWTHIDPLRHVQIAPLLRDEGDYVLLLPVDIAEDVRHAAEISRSQASVTVFFTRCGEHNILAELQRNGLLDGFICALVEDARDLSRFGYQRLNRDTLAALALILKDGVELASLKYVSDFAEADPGVLPTYLYRALYDARICHAIRLGKRPPKAFPAHARQVCWPHELRRYAAEGWYAFDQGFTWSEGVHHFIRFHVLDFEEHRDVRVRLFFLPHINERHQRQRITFAVNGQTLQETTVCFRTPSATCLEVVLALTEALNEIHIVTPACISPAQLNIGDDTRTIALSFNHMLFEAS